MKGIVLFYLVLFGVSWLQQPPLGRICYFGTETRVLTDIKTLEAAVMFYEAEFEVPLLTWSQLMEPDPPFVNEIPLDPWGAEYLLEVDPSHESFRIGTYGEDGIPGGSGDDADVFSEWRVRE